MKTLSAVLAAFFLSGCVSTHSLGDKPEGWISDQNSVLVFTWSKNYYCMANKDSEGRRASPVCVEPTYIERGQTVRPASKLDER